MNALSALKQAMREGVELTNPQEVYALGIRPADWPKIVTKLGIGDSFENVRRCAQGKDLLVVIKTVDRLLSAKSKFAQEIKVGEKFGIDTLPANFPWSILQKLRDDVEKELLHRRSLIIEALTIIAKDELTKEQAEASEKARLQKVPKMRQSSHRKTLKWHRLQARKKRGI